jgi:hypothetical protein
VAAGRRRADYHTKHRLVLRTCCDQVSYVNDTRGGAKAVAVLAEARTYDE